MTPDDPQPSDTFKRSFIRLVLEDVLAARSSMGSTDEGAGPRNAVRATFAAVEGALWIAREHVLEIATAMGTLTPLAGMALREQTYVVTSDGTVMEQTRAVAMPATVRLIDGQARLIAPDLRVRYDHAGWAALQAASRIRNRITHPKGAADLEVTDADLAITAAGLSWLLATVQYIMAATSLAYRSFADERRIVLDALIAGDPDMLRAYDEALRQQESPD